jgi:hypothetical protein
LAGDVPIALAKNFRVYFVRIDQTLAVCMIVVDLRIVITFITAILSDYHVAGFDDSSKPFRMASRSLFQAVEKRRTA